MITHPFLARSFLGGRLACWLAVLIIAATSKLEAALPPPVLPSIVLGESTLVGVLHCLGPSDGIGLVGDSEEGGGAPGDDLQLRYESRFVLSDTHPATIYLWFDGKSFLFEAARIEFKDPAGIAPEEILTIYGGGKRVVRQRLAEDPDGIEDELSACDDPAGEFLSWIYHDRALQVEIFGGTPESPRVTALRFSLALWSESVPFPRCGAHRD